jgi:hypothetical protein
MAVSACEPRCDFGELIAALHQTDERRLRRGHLAWYREHAVT